MELLLKCCFKVKCAVFFLPLNAQNLNGFHKKLFIVQIFEIFFLLKHHSVSSFRKRHMEQHLLTMTSAKVKGRVNFDMGTSSIEKHRNFYNNPLYQFIREVGVCIHSIPQWFTRFHQVFETTGSFQVKNKGSKSWAAILKAGYYRSCLAFLIWYHCQIHKHLEFLRL